MVNGGMQARGMCTKVVLVPELKEETGYKPVQAVYYVHGPSPIVGRPGAMVVVCFTMTEVMGAEVRGRQRSSEAGMKWWRARQPDSRTAYAAPPLPACCRRATRAVSSRGSAVVCIIDCR